MSTVPFPTFRCIPADSLSRDAVFDGVVVQRARDGSELRLDFGGSGYRYEFTIYAIDTERATLTDFFNARRGKWDTFLFTDPIDGVERLVRFDMDRLQGRQPFPGVMEYRIAIVTVVVAS